MKEGLARRVEEPIEIGIAQFAEQGKTRLRGGVAGLHIQSANTARDGRAIPFRYREFRPPRRARMRIVKEEKGTAKGPSLSGEVLEAVLETGEKQ